ncbi:MAG: L-serine ammonia-lyase, iron-sulfur-dependent, subunit alpha [Clostridiaceae bacterium]
MYPRTGEELIEICKKDNIKIWECAINAEIEDSEMTYEEIYEKMKKNLRVMEESSTKGLKSEVHSISGLIGGDAFKINEYIEKEQSFCGEYVVRAMARALSSSEVNASMGKIVACPTAGACGILPSVLITAKERYNKTEDDVIKALFTASLVGIIIARNASISGAEGGCQAECGSASAMAAAAVIEMIGGEVEEALNAAAIVIKNILGLVCDPVAGLVEVPCAKRNAIGAVIAMGSVDLTLAGVKSIIPFDEVVLAMQKVGKCMPVTLKETALGGLATTPTGIKIKNRIFSNEQGN